MQTNHPTLAAQKRARRAYKRTHPNGKIPDRLDENDRSVIKTFCEISSLPLRSVVDLTKNESYIYQKQDGHETLLGTVRKVVYKKTFEVLQPFKLYTTRDQDSRVKPESTTIEAGTRIFTSDDFCYFWIPVPTDQQWVKVERWVVVKNTTLRQIRSLFLMKGIQGRQAKESCHSLIDMVEFVEACSLKPK